MGTQRYRKLRQLVEAKPFDAENIPPNLLKRFMAGDQYLLLIFSPADKNFFDVRNIYQLEKEITELKTTLAKEGIHFAVLNENLLAAAILGYGPTERPSNPGLGHGTGIFNPALGLPKSPAGL